MFVDIRKIKECLEYLHEVNSEKLENIVWCRDGAALAVTPEELNEYKFIGLSNKDFPANMGWLDD